MDDQNQENQIVSEPLVEYEDMSTGLIMDNPFNPNKIDITTKPLTIDLLIKRLKANPPEIDLEPAFQRKKDLWDVQKQSQLIESLLIKFPLPAFYFDGTDNNCWLVVDGLQRLSSLSNFMVNKKLKLKGLEFLNKLEGMGFDELPRNMQRQIEEAQITAYIINPGTPDEVKFNIFKRINTAGLWLNTQEIRHALNQGIPASFVAELADTQEFKEATNNSVRTERMVDREFVTRFLSFYLHSYLNYVPDLDTFMNKTMNELKKTSVETRAKIKKDFISAMILSKNIFGDWAFRKADQYPEKKKPINKALFEVLSVLLSKLNDEEKNILSLKKEIIFEKFVSTMKNDSVFYNSITTATGNKGNVAMRFSRMEILIKEVLSL